MNSGRALLHWPAARWHGFVLIAFLTGFTVAHAQGAAANSADTTDQTTTAALTDQDPVAFLEDFSDRALELLADGTLSADQRRDGLQRFFRLGFDLDSISRFVLGRHWRAASEPERSEFKALFEAFIVGFYSNKLDGYSGETLRLGATRRLDDETAAVSSQIIRPRGAAIRLDWRLKNQDQNWRIVDVVVEGVSLAIVQRSEFDSVIRNNGGKVESLLAVLREKTR